MHREPALQEAVIIQLARVFQSIGIYSRDHIDDALKVIKEYSSQPNLMKPLLTLIEALCTSLGKEIHRWLPDIMPRIIRAFRNEHNPNPNPNRDTTNLALDILVAIGPPIVDYTHLVVPAVVSLFEFPFSDSATGEERRVLAEISLKAIQAMAKLSRHLDLKGYSSRLLQPLLRVLEGTSSHFVPLTGASTSNLASSSSSVGGTDGVEILQQAVLRLFSDLMDNCSAREEYLRWFEFVSRQLTRWKIADSAFEASLTRLRSPFEESVHLEVVAEEYLETEAQSTESTETLDMTSIQRTWEPLAQRSKKEDWTAWFKRFALGLLKASPSSAIRSCLGLADYYPLVRELFNPAFLSCWNAMTDSNRSQLLSYIDTTLRYASNAPETVQSLLDLAEFMEHDDQPLALASDLGKVAERCKAYAKALHYKESLFNKDPSDIRTIESLISLNTALGEREAANGYLKYLLSHVDYSDARTELLARWYGKLGRWEEALESYTSQYNSAANKSLPLLGMMRCYEALGEWEELDTLAMQVFQDSQWSLQLEEIDLSDPRNRMTFTVEGGETSYLRSQVATLAAKAAWSLKAWDRLERHVTILDPNSVDGAFLRSLVALQKGKYEEAQEYVNTTRDLLSVHLPALVGESYQRAYDVFVSIQELTEIEDIIELKTTAKDNEERKAVIFSTWNARLKGIQPDLEVWRRLLRIRSIHCHAIEQYHGWIKFASLCRHEGQFNLARRTLEELLGPEHVRLLNNHNLSPSQFSGLHPEVSFAYFKQMWVESEKMQVHAFNGLQKLAAHLDNCQGNTRTKAHIALRLGNWQLELQWYNESNSCDKSEVIPYILQYFEEATKNDPDWHKAWHAWGIVNSIIVEYYQEKNWQKSRKRLVKEHVLSAVSGFINSIALSPGNNLQDTLRLLEILYSYSEDTEIESAIIDGVSALSIDIWLEVIPQIIARIQSGGAIGKFVKRLLLKIGLHHPQALVYPLSVAATSHVLARMGPASSILKKMKQHSAVLVEQASLVSKELIRVAILWHEMWHEALEDASRAYFGNHDVDGMFDRLMPLHEILLSGPTTPHEKSFHQHFGKELDRALDCCQKFQQSDKVADLNNAWDLYYHVFRRIDKQLPQMTALELQFVSPALLECQNMELAVPGTYEPGKQVVRISSFFPLLQVFGSKQRPRRLSIAGCDGLEWSFLLKGHEDLRQDERVMQLFGLVNTLLKKDVRTRRNDLAIETYPVVPLSPNSGLLGWVTHSDTFHQLIREYRTARDITLNIEQKLMLRMGQDFEKLTLLQKIEVFEFALESTSGMDLERIIWLKSPNSETWMVRRANFTRSLAVMSMVGYILGLGDRHPSNLMLSRHTGKVIHIDFGDCFEVAMKREKYPEKIPFRLTRMLQNAMEVSKIEGNFKTTCINTMTVLRENSESLMAVLEAFVHDPLINWRLMEDEEGSCLSTSDFEGEGASPSFVGRTRRSISIQERSGNGEEALNEKALEVTKRIKSKLKGRDFNPNHVLGVADQVDELIVQATAVENLCQCYIGWCPFW
eukprot:TRINITY_DN6037_c0_g2_i1.p1 TRINITY_DN6037_c0_g2~~TRINITY_DN6037_c0_g2_i1.p1  ORF type:complete len:1532 (-),score=302.75 TRINITY_DN6037_c0_g2_i1:8-4603(-)